MPLVTSSISKLLILKCIEKSLLKNTRTDTFNYYTQRLLHNKKQKIPQIKV